MIIYILCALIIILAITLIAFVVNYDKHLQRVEHELIYLNIKFNALRKNSNSDDIKFNFIDDLWR